MWKFLYKSCISEQQSEPSNFNFFEDTNILNADEKESCEGLLTNAECLQALKSMGPEKTPGSDSIPAEFYKIFWRHFWTLGNLDQPCIPKGAVLSDSKMWNN